MAQVRTPYDASTAKGMLEQTAVLLEGTVTSIAYSYDSTLGPRTNVTFGSLVVHAGTYSGPTLVVSQLGGPLPDSTYFWVDDYPVYISGGRYLLFLRNTTWFVSPVIGEHAYRIDSVGTKQVVVTTDGLAANGINAEGIQFCETPAFDDAVEMSAPHAQPAVDSAATPTALATAWSSAQFVANVLSYASAQGIAISGSVTLTPAAGRTWNIMPSVDESGGGATCPTGQTCPTGDPFCSGDTVNGVCQ